MKKGEILMHQAIKYGMLSLAKYLIDIPEIDIKKLDGVLFYN